jgi:hypothetical protein
MPARITKPGAAATRFVLMSALPGLAKRNCQIAGRSPVALMKRVPAVAN